MTKKTTQPQTQPEAIVADVQALPIEEAENIVQLSKSRKTRRNIFETEDVQITEQAQNKVQLVSETRQRLAEAKDYADKGGEQEALVQEALDKAARQLVLGRVTGVLSADEVTDLVGGVFGFQRKKDGTPSKTPEGAGNTVRQRIVRLTNAYEFADDGHSDDAFFRPIDADAKGDVKDVLTAFEHGPEDGGITIWTAYSKLAEIKRDNVQRIPFVRDARRIAGLATAISEDVSGLASLIANDKALRAAYRSLWKMVNLTAEEASEMTEAA